MTIVEQDEEADAGRSPLLPHRHPTGDLFVCDIFDAAPKGDMASMEHPIFSLSTKPDLRIRRYEHGSRYVEITPSVKGLATVHDRDVLIYCISQIMAALNLGKSVSQTVRLKAFDLLIATNRATSGEGYEGLKAALERLGGGHVSALTLLPEARKYLKISALSKSQKLCAKRAMAVCTKWKSNFPIGCLMPSAPRKF